MHSIFKDEWRENGPNSSNPERTGRICPLDVTLSGLKWTALQRRSKLANEQMRPASTTTLTVHRP